MTHTRPRLDDAACRGRDDLFLKPEPRAGDRKAMKAICDGCPDRAECLAYSVAHEEFGFWAGTTSYERRKLRDTHGIPLVSINNGDYTKSS